MDLNRADSSQITSDARQRVLAAYGLDTDTAPFAIGTEAEVYAYDAPHILKIYADASRFSYLETLREFYAMLDTSDTTLTLPTITEITRHGDVIAVLERRVAGVPLAAKLSTLTATQHEQAEHLYVDAVFQLRRIAIQHLPETYLLFDDEQRSSTGEHSFNAFYAGFLKQKVARVGEYFVSVHPDFEEQARQLVQVIQNSTTDTLSIVHGDFFPGNVLVSDDMTRVQGVIDFGSFTMYGHYLLDVAGAFGFYRMYDPDHNAIRQRLLTNILHRLDDSEQPHFFQYLLANAILTSDLYAPHDDPTDDGHFQWAAQLIADSSYWRRALDR